MLILCCTDTTKLATSDGIECSISIMATVTGQLPECSPESESLTTYVERVKLFIKANGIEDGRKVAELLSVIGGKTFTHSSETYCRQWTQRRSRSMRSSLNCQNVRSFSVSNLFWIAFLLSPHTNRSCSTSSENDLNSQYLASRLSSAMNSATDSPAAWFCL